MHSCISKLAASIGMDCAHPLVGGYTGRAVIFEDSADVLSVVFDTSNPRVIVNFQSRYAPTLVDNAMLTTPFDGSNVTGSADAGFAQFVKVFSGRILTRGADTSKDIVEPLVNGRFLIMMERRETHLIKDGRGIEVIGAIKPARCVDPSTVVRNENENGGAISFSLQTVEPYLDVDFRSPLEEYDEMTNHQWFDELFNLSASSLAMFAEH